MIPTPKFKSVLNRAIKLYIKEIEDGCVDCQSFRKAKGSCIKHEKVFDDVILHPTKYIKIDSKTLKVTFLIKPEDV